MLLVAHGNSLRALIMNLEGLTGEEILSRELATGAPIVYQLGANGLPTDRQRPTAGAQHRRCAGR